MVPSSGGSSRRRPGQDEVELDLDRQFRTQFLQGIHRVGQAGAVNLVAPDVEVGIRSYGQFHHLYPVAGFRQGLAFLEPGPPRRNEKNLVQLQANAALLGDEQVAQVDRVKGAAKYTCAHENS